jgi:Fe-Mn family superoxide dismutase
MKNFIQLFESESRPEKLTLYPLPYAQDALEPVMSADTVKYHYNKLSQAYVDRYNAGEGDADFNYGGAMLHNLWWSQLRSPRGANKPTGAIAEFIDKEFGDYPTFQDQFTETAMGIQGSGWCYLSRAGEIKTIKNQDYNRSIILPIDTWEHAYLLERKPDKVHYFKNIWKIINWDSINQRLV